MELEETTRDEVLRERAIRRLKKRRDFAGHLLVYTLVNTFLVLIWFMSGSDGFFWPVFPIVGWGIGVVMNAWDVYRNDGFDETQIRREMERLRRMGGVERSDGSVAVGPGNGEDAPVRELEVHTPEPRTG
jgi:hypothetical protein